MNKKTTKSRLRRLEKKRSVQRSMLMGSEVLEERRLLSVTPHDNYVATDFDINGPGQQTERVAAMITKVPAGPNQALSIMANWTDVDDLQVEIKIDNNGNGTFEASETFTTAGDNTHSLATIAAPDGGTSPDNNIHPQGSIGADGEGAYSRGYSCSFPEEDDCGFDNDNVGSDAVNSAVYIHPIGSSPIDRKVMVTLIGGGTTDIMASIGTYDNVAQSNPVDNGNAYAVGNAIIDYGSTFDQPGNSGANDEGDAITTGPSGTFVNHYPTTVPGTAITGTAGNVFLDAVHARFDNGEGTGPLNPTGNSISAGGSQTAIPTGQTGGNYTDSGARSSGGASISSDGSFTWAFTDTVEPTGARFFSHAAVEVRMDDGVVSYDYGDAPDPDYATLLASNGPRHATQDALGNALDSPYFGTESPDAETEGLQSNNARGDDNDGTNDEDGLVAYANDGSDESVDALFVSDPMNTSAATVTLDVQGVSDEQPGFVSAWIDWNADGDFEDANELFATGFAVTEEGEVSFPVTIPAAMDGAVTDAGRTIMRIRVHSDPCDTGAALDPTGHANDGEVEDHRVNVLQGSSLHGTKYEDVNGDGTADEDVVIPNAGEGDVNGVVIRLEVNNGSWGPVTDLLGNPVEDVETDSSGNYWFSYLAPGEYRISERLGDTDINDDGVFDDNQGLTQVVNSDFPVRHTVDLGTDNSNGVVAYESEKIEDLDFLNYVQGSIHGVKFEDIDADGEFDFPDEIGLPGVTFALFKFVQTNTYKFDPFTTANDITYTTYEWDYVTATDSMEHGEFWFTGLEPGRYVVRELPKSNNNEFTGGPTSPALGNKWAQSTDQPTEYPDSLVELPLDLPDVDVTVEDINDAFDVFLGADPDSPGTATLTVNSRDELQWDDDSDPTFQVVPYEGEAYSRPMDTDGSGLIEQDEIDAINEATALKNGSAAYDSGPTSLIFGNFKYAEVTGQKNEIFKAPEATASNGVFAPETVGFEGIEFELYKDVNEDGLIDGGDELVDTQETDGTGEFKFTDIMPGMQYIVIEKEDQSIDPDDDNQLADGPDNEPYVFIAESGETYDAGIWDNYVLGSIHGVKFEDTDADKSFDFADGERGIEDVTFHLYRFVETHMYTYDPFTTNGPLDYTTYEWEYVTSTTSMEHGEFWFTDLEPGVYVVREEVPDGWMLSTGQAVGDPDAEVVPPTAPFTVDGIKAAFDGDLGDDPEAGETGALTIYSRDELQWDDETTFEFDPYLGAAYDRPLDTNDDGVIDENDEQADVSLKDGSDALPSLIFGNFQYASVTGTKLETNTANGSVGFEGIEFELYEDNNGNGNINNSDDLIATATTGPDGTFTFSDLMPGMSYIIIEKEDQTLDPTSPDEQLTNDASKYAFTPNSGEDIVIEDAWENYIYGSIHGVKFEDVNADGEFDFPDEIGLPGVTFALFKFVDTHTYTFNPFTTLNKVTYTTYEWEYITATDSVEHGEFWFTDLDPGRYVVRELPKMSDNPFTDAADDATSPALGNKWVQSTEQLTTYPDSDLDLPVDPTAQEVFDAFEGTFLGDDPDAAPTGTLTIYSGDELQWDDDSTFTVDPYEGEAYNRPIDGMGGDLDGLISQDEIDFANDKTSLKTGSDAYDSGASSLIFGNFKSATVTGQKNEIFKAPESDSNEIEWTPVSVGFEGIEFELYKDVNEDGQLDDGDELVDTTKSDDTGEFKFTGIVPGMKYIVIEKEDQEIDPDDDNQLADGPNNTPFVFTAESGETYDAGTWENYILGSIHGVKFEDDNANGSFNFNTGERGLEGVTFELFKFVKSNNYTFDFFTTSEDLTYTTYSWTKVATTVSMAHGEFWFTDLEPGKYVVREVQQDGWIQSTNQSIESPVSLLGEIPTGDPVTAQEIIDAFDTHLGDDPTANATGTLMIYSGDELQWDDDSTFEFDPYIGAAYNRPMDTNGDGLIDDNDEQADASLKTGSAPYRSGPRSLIFGNYQNATIAGTKLEVETANGDVGFEGIEFELFKDVNGNGIVNPGQGDEIIATATTGPDGTFEFTGIMPGMQYTVREKSDQTLDPLGNQLSPDDAVYTFTPASGDDLVIEDAWENYIYGSIHGVKFEDLNADGEFDFDDGERGIEGVTFNLYKFVETNTYTYDVFTTAPAQTYKTYEWVKVEGKTTASMEHGEFWFTDLEPGVYVVREDISSTDWNQSTDQGEGSPDSEVVLPVPEFTAQKIIDAFDADRGDDPSDSSTGALTIYSGDELQWDDDTTFTADPYEGEAYNRPMDGKGGAEDGVITQDEIDYANDSTSLKTGSDAYDSGASSLIFGNFKTVEIRGFKYEDIDNDGPDGEDPGFEGITFLLTGTDGMGQTVELSAETNANGRFRFQDLKPGTYTIAEAPITDENDDGYDDVTGLSGCDDEAGCNPVTVTVESGDGVVNVGDWYNHVLGSIHGVKFLDYDRDTYWDYEDRVEPVSLPVEYDPFDMKPKGDVYEPALEGVKFDLYKLIGTSTYTYDPFSAGEISFTTYEWEKIASTYSDVHGEFWFTDLVPGMTYTVREDLSGTGYEQTTSQPEGNPTSEFDPDSIDANNNGIITEAEILAAKDVFLGDSPSGGKSEGYYYISSGREFQWDDDSMFMNVPYDGEAYDRPMDLDGNGLISEEEEQAAVDGAVLKKPQFAPALMFGNTFVDGEIHGFKFHDLDGDGEWDHVPGTEYIPGNGEPGMPNVLVGLEDSEGNIVTLANGQPALTKTDENGEFWFTDVPPGMDVTIVEYLYAPDPESPNYDTLVNCFYHPFSDTNLNGVPDGEEGLYQTTAPETVNLEPGEELYWDPTTLIIGNSVTGSIHGFKYEDFNVDGDYDPDAHWPEVPMEWVVFELYDEDGNLVDTQMTDPNGEFWFTDLELGTYTVLERLDLTDRNDLVGPGSNGNPGPPDGLPDGNGIYDDQEGLGATTPTSWTVTISSGEEYVWAPGAAMLTETTTIDPDDASVDENIEYFFDDVKLEEEFADILSGSFVNPVFAIEPVFATPSTGDLVFGHKDYGRFSPYDDDAFIYPTVGGSQSHVFRATFDYLAVKSVSIDFIFNPSPSGVDDLDQGLLVAYAENGDQLDTQFSELIGEDGVATVTVTAPEGRSIQYVEAAGNPFHTALGSTVALDNLVYETFSLKHEVLVETDLMFGNYYAGGVQGIKTHADSDAGVPGIELKLSNSSNTYTTTTAADGSYDFGDVFPGLYTLSEIPSPAVIESFDPFPVNVHYGTVLVSEVGLGDLYPGLQVEEVDESLAITNLVEGSIHGIKVHEDTGIPLEGITFELRQLGGAKVAEATTGEDGEFSFDGLVPATYLVIETDSGQPNISPLASFVVTVNSGEEHVWAPGAAGDLDPGQVEVTNSTLTVENELEGSVHGQVLDENGLGLGGISVSLSDTDTIEFTITDNDGYFHFDGLLPGTYDVVVLTGGLSDPDATVVVSSGEEEMSESGIAPLAPGQYETINEELEFQLLSDLTPPVVTDVSVSSTLWTDGASTNNFLGVIDPGEELGYEIPTGSADQFDPLPWRNVNVVYVEFNENVVEPGAGWESAVALFDSVGAVAIDSISYDAPNFRLAITTPITTGIGLEDNRYLVAIDDTVTDGDGTPLDGEFENGVTSLVTDTSGDGVAGGKFEFEFAIQHADANQSGGVDVTDLNRLGVAFGSAAGNVAPDADYDPFTDFNGSGTVDVTDLQILGTNFGDNTLGSTPQPTNPLFLNAASVAAALSVPESIDPFGDDDGEDEDGWMTEIATDVALRSTTRTSRIS